MNNRDCWNVYRFFSLFFIRWDLSVLSDLSVMDDVKLDVINFSLTVMKHP